MRKCRWAAIALIVVAALGAYVYGRVTFSKLGEYYQEALINKTREDAEQLVGAPPNRFWKGEVLRGAAFYPAVEAVGHWYTSKGTISILFDKSGRATRVDFDPAFRRQGSMTDHLFYLVGW